MPIDVGMKILINETAGEGTTSTDLDWLTLKDCLAVPALIQPSSKISVDYVGDEYITELLGKKSITGLDFTFAYDGTATGAQYKKLADLDKAGTKHWFKVVYPDGTKFEMLVGVEVSLVAVTPSSELQYTLSVVPNKTSALSSSSAIELVHIVEVGGTDPIAN